MNRSWLLPVMMLLISGPAILAGAPAEVAPATVDREPAWGPVVEGLRARLVPAKARFKANENLFLRLEIENVSGRIIVLEEPSFRPLIGPPPTGEVLEGDWHPWTITARPAKTEIERARERCKVERASCLRLLHPGQRHVVEITGISDGLMEKKLRERRKGEPQKEELPFVYSGTPGRYVLQVRYFRPQTPDQAFRRVEGWPGGWLETPAVEIEIVE